MEANNKGKIAAVDLGTAKVCAAVGEIGEAGQIILRGVGTGLARGWRSFAITAPDEAATSIAHAVTRASRMAAAPVTQVVLSLSGPFYDFVTTSVLVQISPVHGKITQADLNSAQDLARDKTLEPDKVVLHVLPKYYLVGQDILYEAPLNRPAKTLQVEYLVIRAPRVLMEGVCSLVQKTGPRVLRTVFPPLADSEVMLANLPPDPGYLLLNLGASITEAVVFKHGLAQAAAVFPVGAHHITLDIAWAMRISQPEAERLKILHGYAWPEGVTDEEEIELLIQGRDKARPRRIYRRFLSEIIYSRLLMIFDQAQKFLREESGGENLPVVMTGGGSLLKGLDKLARATFGANVRREIPEGDSDIVDSPVYTTGVGLLLYGLKNRLYGGRPAAADNKLSWRDRLGRVWRSLSDVF